MPRITSRTRYLFGRILFRIGRADRAVTQFRAALSASPDFVAARLFLAESLAIVGQLDAAIGEYQTLSALMPDWAHGYVTLGTFLCRAQRHDEAIEVLQNAAERDPHDVVIHCNLGASYSAVGRLQDALVAYTTWPTPASVRCRPVVRPRGHVGRARSLAGIGRRPAAGIDDRTKRRFGLSLRSRAGRAGSSHGGRACLSAGVAACAYGFDRTERVRHQTPSRSRATRAGEAGRGNSDPGAARQHSQRPRLLGRSRGWPARRRTGWGGARNGPLRRGAVSRLRSSQRDARLRLDRAASTAGSARSSESWSGTRTESPYALAKRGVALSLMREHTAAVEAFDEVARRDPEFILREPDIAAYAQTSRAAARHKGERGGPAG